MVVDNVDQFESDTAQSRIFGDAIAIAQRLGLSLVLAMRDSTYVQNKSKPIFDAFDFDPIQVEPPDVKSVLSRRFAVARELLTGKSVEFVAENGIRVSLEDSRIIVDLVVESVLNTAVGDAISVLAAGDVRLCLRMTREFLRNGYSATGKAINIYQKTGRYRLPEHEAMRAIMLGNQSVYSEEFSPVANPFDAKLSMTSAQLLRIFILEALVTRHSSKSSKSVEGEEIRTTLLEIGFAPEITLSVLQGMCDARYIFTTSHSKATFEASYVPSRLGGHVARTLISTFVFLENVMVDTFIDDETVWERLYKLTQEIYAERSTVERIHKRVRRVTAFFDHLSGRYAVLQEEAKRRAVGKEWIGNPFQSAQTAFLANCERVGRGAQKNYGPAPVRV